jgi:hypothetical protein
MKRRASRTNLGYITALTLFAVAMGHLEAVVVVYIRHIMGIVPPPEHLDANIYAQVPHWIIVSEQGREAATIVMLVTLALLAGRSRLERVATFLFAFGVWDIWYYVALKLLLDWPASLQTLDLLFLIPKAWFAPVWLPCTISALMISAAMVMFAKAQKQ